MANFKLFSLDDETGEVNEISKKTKRKFGKGFYMGDQISAEEIAADKDLCGNDMRVFWFLLSKIDYDNIAIVTQHFIAEKIDIPQANVSRSIKKLCQKHYIEKVIVNGNNAYSISKHFAVKGERHSKGV